MTDPFGELPDLFRPLHPANPEYPSVIGGDYESPDRIAASFLEAADRLAAAWRAERDERGRELFIALPILQTYRHAIELILKAACLRMGKLQERTLELGYGTKTAPDELEDVLGHTHGIAELVDLVHILVDGLDVDKQTSQLPDDVRDTLGFLHEVDERGQAFRYGTHRTSRKPPVWEPVRPNEVAIYLEGAITRLKDAAQLLVNGLGGYLDAYEGNINDMWSEWQNEIRGWGDGY